MSGAVLITSGVPDREDDAVDKVLFDVSEVQVCDLGASWCAREADDEERVIPLDDWGRRAGGHHAASDVDRDVIHLGLASPAGVYRSRRC